MTWHGRDCACRTSFGAARSPAAPSVECEGARVRWRAQAGWARAAAAATTFQGSGMSDLVRQNSRKPPTLMTQSSETRSEQDVSSTGGADSPGRRRRASLDRPGLATRRSKAPDAETNALLRDRFLHHLVTQVKLSSVVRAGCCRVCAAL